MYTNAHSIRQRDVKLLSDLHKHTNWPSHRWKLVWEADWLLQWPLDMRCLNAIEAVFCDCLSIYHALSSIGDNMWLVCGFLVAGCTRTGQSYDVIVARVSSLGRGCGKKALRVAEQPFVIETCNLGHNCTVTWLIDCGISWISSYCIECTRLAGVKTKEPTWAPSECNENICHNAHSIHTLLCIIGQKFLSLSSLGHHAGAPLANYVYEFWKYASSCVRYKLLRIVVVQLVDYGVMIVLFSIQLRFVHQRSQSVWRFCSLVDALLTIEAQLGIQSVVLL